MDLAMGNGATRGATLAQLARQLEQWEEAHSRAPAEWVSTGCSQLDAKLPGGGLRRGSIVEWLAEGAGSGAGTLAWVAARSACRANHRHEGREKTCLIVDPAGEFYPPAAFLFPEPNPPLVVVRPALCDLEWTLDQSLRCPAVGAVLLWSDPDELHSARARSRGGHRRHGRGLDLRRLRLSAEKGGVVGFFLRAASARQSPCWGDVRFGVEPVLRPDRPEHRTVRVVILRCRNASPGSCVEIELDARSGAPLPGCPASTHQLGHG